MKTKTLHFKTFVIALFLSITLIGQNREIEWVTAEIADYGCIVEWNSDCTDCTYELVRITDFNFCAGETPEDGLFASIPNFSNPFYDSINGNQTSTYFAYGVREVFDDDSYSDWTYSNVVSFHINDLEFFIRSCCDIPTNDSLNIITLTNNCTGEVLQQSYEGFPEVIFNNIVDGNYNLRVDVEGFVTYRHNGILIHENMYYNIDLQQPVYKPRNVKFDTTTSMFTWDTPLIGSLDQQFKSVYFPPNNWYTESNGNGWFRSNDGGTSGFPVPYHESYYAIVNNDTASENNDGCCDELISTKANLRYSDSSSLKFDSYFTGAGGQTATVFISLDDKESWDTLLNLSPDTSWKNILIDLTEMSGFYGEESVYFKFQTNDHGGLGSGWAIDNILIDGGEYFPEYFWFLEHNGSYDVHIANDTNSYFVDGLIYGQEYYFLLTSYECCQVNHGFHEPIESAFLPPVNNFHLSLKGETRKLSAKWTPPVNGGQIPTGLSFFFIYQDGIKVGSKAYSGEGIDDTLSVSFDVEPGLYNYCIKARYDLTNYGYPGELGESALLCINYDVIYGFELPFAEDWSSCSFELNEWMTNSENWYVECGNGDYPSTVVYSAYDNTKDTYQDLLSSQHINTTQLTEGNIWLDFHLKLDDIESGSNEFMNVVVNNGEGWISVYERNNNASFDWDSIHLDISQWAMGKVFQIGFEASGENNSNFDRWMIDNIEVYRTCAGACNLAIEIDTVGTGEYSIIFSWEPCNKAPFNNYKIGETGQLVSREAKDTQEFSGINIYRSINGSEFEFIDFIPYTDGEIQYPYPENGTGDLHCYKLTAVFESETDYCESAPFTAKENPDEDFVCILLTSENEKILPDLNQINIFPNPATVLLNISSTITIKQIEIINLLGQTIIKKEINSQEYLMNTSGLENGIYIFKIETDQGLVNKRVVISEF